LFQKSAAVNDNTSVSNEAKLANYTNLQLHHLSLNIDDLARDILYIRNRMYEERDSLSKLDTKLDMVMHVLSDTSVLKEQLAASTAKLEGRLQVLESLLSRATQIKKSQSKTINPSVLKSVLQGPPDVLLKKHKKHHSN